MKDVFFLSKQLMAVLVVMFFGIFVFSFYLLFPIINSAKMPDWVFGPIGLFVILGFDVGWVLLIRSIFKKHNILKILLIMLGITLSTSFLAWWIIEKTSLFDHMFG
jgi:4-amino-4-deoxy-L-arabinose transferase-like glycosyltransferase